MSTDQIDVIWGSLIKHANDLADKQAAYDMRRRLNPHHPVEDQVEEARRFIAWQQLEWKFLKETYVQNREALMEAKSASPHRIAFVREMEKVLADDVERAIFGGG